MFSSIDVGEHLQATTETSGHLARCALLVDSSERHAALVDVARRSDDFDVRIGHLTVVDYCLAAASLLSGRRICGLRRLVDGRAPIFSSCEAGEVSCRSPKWGPVDTLNAPPS
jgi:hypothetical protein